MFNFAEDTGTPDAVVVLAVTCTAVGKADVVEAVVEAVVEDMDETGMDMKGNAGMVAVAVAEVGDTSSEGVAVRLAAMKGDTRVAGSVVEVEGGMWEDKEAEKMMHCFPSCCRC